MTSISSGSATLSTLMALYENENAAAGKSGTLTKDQVSTLQTMLTSGSSTTDSSGSSSVVGSTDLSAILDQIEAKKAASTNTSDSSSSTSTTQTLQQKAASVMQSVYESQQTNLFSLIG